MSTKVELTTLFAISAFTVQGVLVGYFALRTWRFSTALRYGWIVTALGIPTMVVSGIFLTGGLPPSFWLGGFLYILCAFFGWWVEYVQCINWRQPMCLPICVGYLAFYLAMLIFYWFPLALDWMPLGYIFGVIFVASTWLNATSRQPTRAAATSNELYQIYPGL